MTGSDLIAMALGGALMVFVASAKADYLCMSDGGDPEQTITCYGERPDGEAATKRCVKPHGAEADCFDQRDEAERPRN